MVANRYKFLKIILYDMFARKLMSNLTGMSGGGKFWHILTEEFVIASS